MKDLGTEPAPRLLTGFRTLPRHLASLLFCSFLFAAGAQAQEQTVLFDFGRHNGRDGAAVSTAPLFLYYASDWAGPNNSWFSRTGTQSLFYDTFGGSAPQKGTSMIAGVAVDTAVFDGNDFLTSSFVTGRPWAGLKEFSLSLVFKSNASGPQTQTDIHAFWNQRGVLGFELGGGGQGEFAIGLYNDGSPNGAVAASTGLGSGDNGTSAGNLNDNNWHTLTMVVKNLANGSFRQTVYVDGAQVGSALDREYGSVGSLADASFSLGTIRDSASAEKFVGEVAALRFDGVPLTASEISALHTDYLGVINTNSRDTIVGRGTATGDTVSYVWNSVGGPHQDQSGASVSFSQFRDQNSNLVLWAIRDVMTNLTEGNGFQNGGLKLVSGQSNSVNPTNAFLGKLAVPDATGDFWYAQNPNRAGFRLTNLDTAQRYRFTLFASRNATNSRFTFYQIAGSNTVAGSLQSSGTDIGAGNGAGTDTNKYDGNDTRTLTLPAVTPAADGTILLTWLGRSDTNFPADFSATNAANSFGYLNLMQVEVFPAGYITYLVDIGNATTTPSTNGIFWNNSSGANNGPVSSLTKLVSSDGQTSNITLTWASSGRGAGGGWGVSFGPNGSPLNMATAYQDGIYLDTANPARFVLGNLQTNRSYQLELFGSRSTNEVRATRYRIIGATTNEVLQTNSGPDLGGPGIPYNRSVASAQVVPAADGTVSVDITREQGTYGHLNAMSISMSPSSTTIPAITSALTATATPGSAFSYQITADGSPTSYNATGLPAGLSINTTNGLISGTPTAAAGPYSVMLSASNATGTGTATLDLTVTAPFPVITSSSSSSGVAGFPFQYQIVADNSPTLYSASNLPAGLNVDSGTGLITGRPSSVGTSTVTLSAVNSYGTGSASMTISVQPPTFSRWTSARGLSGAAAALGADADGNGMVNLMEYGLLADPATAATASQTLPVLSQSNGYLTLTYLRRTNDASVSVRAEYSGNLLPGGWIPETVSNGPVATSTNAVSGNEGVRVTVRSPQPISSGSRGFLRAIIAQPTNSVLVVGSSIMAYWTNIATDLAPIPILNKGWAGSTTPQWLSNSSTGYWASRVVSQTNSALIYYCGSNDVGAGTPSATIVANTIAFFQDFWARYPDAPAIYLAVQKAPVRKSSAQIPNVNEVNNQMRDWIATQPRARYVDCNSVLVDANDTAIPGMFGSDNLHLTLNGYAAITTVILPVLQEMWYYQVK
jgi:hypothetical protein